MTNHKLFYSEKNEVYFYVTEGKFSLCKVCLKEIDKNLVYHTVWTKKNAEIRTYHVRCFEKIHNRGYIDEFKTCVVIDTIPEDSLPVFERRPALTNKNDLSTFNVSEITKNSEAQIIDRTKISKDPNQSKTIDFERNVLTYRKREEELGDSIFITYDKLRDKFQITKEHLKEEDNKDLSVKEKIEKDAQKINQKNEKNPERKRLYADNISPEANRELFFENLKKLEILLPGQELIMQLNLESSMKMIEDKGE
ncbi:TPA: hypothetical protein HA234_01135 [Candidatus Woesearchaeota archaeon]|nr:hypothetical protein [Candidatus Woesearchaeota archaeon]HIG92783.1 hypothetical protein [Candidatus Woesearchaeota archaeon]